MLFIHCNIQCLDLNFFSLQLPVDPVHVRIEPDLHEMCGQYWPFQGINIFDHLDYKVRLVNREAEFDIGINDVPFNTAISYRPGARFGPRALRAALQRQTCLSGYKTQANLNPCKDWFTIMDCGDILVAHMYKDLAFQQMTMAFEELLFEHSSGKQPARYVALGDEHSTLLPRLCVLRKLHFPVNIIHFDAHLDTWKPDKYSSFCHTLQSQVNHDSMIWNVTMKDTPHHIKSMLA